MSGSMVNTVTAPYSVEAALGELPGILNCDQSTNGSNHGAAK